MIEGAAAGCTAAALLTIVVKMPELFAARKKDQAAKKVTLQRQATRSLSSSRYQDRVKRQGTMVPILRKRASFLKEIDEDATQTEKIHFDPAVLEDKGEATEFNAAHFENNWRIVVFVAHDPGVIEDNVQKILDVVAKFTSLRYGDFKDVVFISHPGVERSCQTAACAKYTFGELFHAFYVAPTVRIEFSIPRNEHLLANLMRGIFNEHPWGEAVIHVHDIREFRRFGPDEFHKLRVADVYRMDESNRTGKVNELERQAMAEAKLRPDDEFVAHDPLGRLEQLTPQLRKTNWQDQYVPEHHSISMGSRVFDED